MHVLVKPVKTDSPEPKALFTHRCAARQLGEISPLPSHFGLLSFPPLRYLPPSWEGEQLWNNLLSQAVSFCQRRLAHSQDCKHLTTARALSMSTRFIHIPH